MKYRILLVLMLALSFGGCQINQMLTQLHYQESAGSGIFAEICTPESQPVFDCKAVTRTKWAVLPPNEPDPVSGEQQGIPIALAGWFYFSAVFIWYLLVGRCDYGQRYYHYLLLLVVCAGVGTSLFYTRILLFGGMEHKCLWCLIAHALNLLLLIGTIMLRPRKPAREAQEPIPDTATEAAGVQFAAEAVPAQTSRVPHPAPRLIIATFVCIYIASQFEWVGTMFMHSRSESLYHQRLAAHYKLDAETVYADTESHIVRFDAAETVEIPLRPDDPQKGDAEFAIPLVVFSDFECPACRVFARDLEKTITPDFEGGLKIIWKHYPLCKDCNPNIVRGIHPEACTTAYAAEAARLQGGNAVFWKVHDLLFARQRKLRGMDYRALALELNLDPDRFVADMASEAVQQRVAEDIALGKTLKVTGTPAIFLANRPIKRFMLMNEGFRKAIHYRLKRARQQQTAIKRWQEMTPEEREEMIKAAQQAKQEREEKTQRSAASDTPRSSDASDAEDAVSPEEHAGNEPDADPGAQQ